MPPLRIRRAAREEIDDAFAWYLQHSATAAERFLDAVDEALLQIAEAPERQALIRGHLRRVLLRRFPYALYYKVFHTSSASLASFTDTGIRKRGFGVLEG